MCKIFDNPAPTSLEFHLRPFPKLVLLQVCLAACWQSVTCSLRVLDEQCTEIEREFLETSIPHDHFSSNSMLMNFRKVLVLADWKFKKTKQTCFSITGVERLRSTVLAPPPFVAINMLLPFSGFPLHTTSSCYYIKPRSASTSFLLLQIA